MVLSDASGMDMKLILKEKGGKRTPVRSVCEPTAVNAKTMIVANGEHISDSQIAEYIEFELNEILSDIHSPDPISVKHEGGHNTREMSIEWGKTTIKCARVGHNNSMKRNTNPPNTKR